MVQQSGMRRLFRQYVAGLSVAYAVLLLWLNHAMLVGDLRATRVAFYLLAASVPALLAGSYLGLRHACWGAEGTVPDGLVITAAGAAFALVLWVASTAFYSASAPIAAPKPPRLGAGTRVTSWLIARSASFAPAPSFDPKIEIGTFLARAP